MRISRMSGLSIMVLAGFMAMVPVATAQWNSGCLSANEDDCPITPGNTQNQPGVIYGADIDQLLLELGIHPDDVETNKECYDHCANAFQSQIAACSSLASGDGSVVNLNSLCINSAKAALEACLQECSTGSPHGF